ncbi:MULTISPECIES: ferredoxin [Mycobacterium]|uniref:NADH-quinone oxidoreductase subunit B family protein n=1 Tax=Mycobacterium TaxID=1763 RepID=UPI00055E4036|nr:MULTISPECIES: ferredoxin [Mycobacterium]ASX02894.1 NADH:ubiquinone oxidoreductase [Mycobacterium intracellulare subsp. chimaera]MCA2275692.1 ferredoxin [Mycobacterium intracellulare]MCA2327246.1 ferredoxin [Mycobacterium intracellulare]PBA57975.1 NADH:ubiquinone oxidoreductase [Mycobacterium intracellulare subsp. chimaera]PBA60030.1 NADH:ubiquinone oxidoreductase [Mycobacterium intracellulare subsp. chimaera]
MPWVFRGLRDGIITSRWPKHADDYFDRSPAAVRVTANPDTRSSLPAAAAAEVCPTAAISIEPQPELDRGRCILCGRCVEVAPQWFAWDSGAAIARLSRETLVVKDVDGSDEALVELRVALAKRVRRLRRSVHLRHIDTGSDGSDEWEIQALTNPVYDLHRLGIFFTASPRHADILLVTGIGAAGMIEPLRRTFEAMPAPTVVIAVGTDAVSGGLIGGGYTGGVGISDVVPVDVWIPGAPASPFSILHGILLALGRAPLVPARSTSC